jgi:Ca2+-binding EF-hand superfamily protein
MPALAPAFAQGAGGMLDRLMAADANRDGAITRAEARAARERGFQRMDADSDGFITTAEREQMAAAASAKGKGRGGEGGGADANGDGKISRDEFLNTPMRGFDRLDANNNDVIEASEIETARQFLGRRKQVTP